MLMLLLMMMMFIIIKQLKKVCIKLLVVQH